MVTRCYLTLICYGWTVASLQRLILLALVTARYTVTLRVTVVVAPLDRVDGGVHTLCGYYRYITRYVAVDALFPFDYVAPRTLLFPAPHYPVVTYRLLVGC